MKTVDYAPTSFWAAFPIPIFTRASTRFPTVASFGLLCLHLSTTSHALSRFELQSKVRLRTTGDPSLNSAPRSLQAVPTSSHINNMCLCVTGSCKLPKVSAKKICIFLKTISVAFNLSKKALTKSTGRCVKSRRNYKSECHTELSRG